MNFYEINLVNNTDDYSIDLPLNSSNNLTLKINKNETRPLLEKYRDEKEIKTILGIRSEDIQITNNKDNIPLRVNIVEILGSETLVYGDLDLSSQEKVSSSKTAMVIKTTERVNYKNGDIIYIKLNSRKMHLFLDDGVDEPSILAN